MSAWMVNTAAGVFFLLAATGLFFFVATRGALIVRGLSRGPRSSESHVYPIYSNMRLIKMVDFQPIISAILLFQYHRLVSKIVAGLRATNLKRKKILITSCAFGNVIPRCVEAAMGSGADKVVIADIIRNELTHAKSKLDRQYGRKIDYVEEDATDMTLREGFADANIMFFLLHELPHDLKVKALAEAGRMLAKGGKLYLGEFHKPTPLVLKCLSWSYFKVFEPLGLALWDSHDPVVVLNEMGGWAVERQTFFFGNFQIITATKQ
ncbi:class I SAM-dependent methyltransferase [Ramlibacter sp.]|uniref:class I SAM-dependent methyltransferase n=1 Tax=Ramlibacter sp. TaxID=1917967 RepID=UPI002BEC0BA3|nr:class I SAM-dependent methyltransferase [Ramlibacter sp.]HWI82807.1 class I SAM-dependent methyltransferase [Ramlibacter sp.]